MGEVLDGYVMLLGLEAGGAANGDAASSSLLAPS
jgi:hypothetical protein